MRRRSDCPDIVEFEFAFERTRKLVSSAPAGFASLFTERGFFMSAILSRPEMEFGSSRMEPLDLMLLNGM
jgi:hypothetical protein